MAPALASPLSRRSSSSTMAALVWAFHHWAAPACRSRCQSVTSVFRRVIPTEVLGHGRNRLPSSTLCRGRGEPRLCLGLANRRQELGRSARAIPASGSLYCRDLGFDLATRSTITSLANPGGASTEGLHHRYAARTSDVFLRMAVRCIVGTPNEAHPAHRTLGRQRRFVRV